MEKTVKTRVGMFEVNSSSCHSLSVCLDNKNLTYQYIEPSNDGNNIITAYVMDELDDVGDHTTPLDKLNYVVSYIEYTKNIKNEKVQSMYDTLHELIREHTGAELVIEDGDSYISDWNDYTSIFSNKDLLKRFLFLPDSHIETSYNG